MNNWQKGIAEWKCGRTLYLSVPFTWLLPEAEKIAKCHNGRVTAGGPAVKLMGAPWASETPDECAFDVLAFHNPCATYTTRGCPNRCKFCAVPKTEGEFRELPSWKPNPMVCDNNILASSRKHFERVIDSLLSFPYVDFNQGLEARKLINWHLDQLGRLRGVKLRFAFDHVNDEGPLLDAISCCKAKGFTDFGVYVLIGFRDTPEDALYRLEKVKSLGIKPQPMRYQPLDSLRKDSYVGPNWTARELKRMVRYWFRQAWLEHIPYEDYAPATDHIEQMQF